MTGADTGQTDKGDKVWKMEDLAFTVASIYRKP